jgi:hypothetical protein
VKEVLDTEKLPFENMNLLAMLKVATLQRRITEAHPRSPHVDVGCFRFPNFDSSSLEMDSVSLTRINAESVRGIHSKR